MRTSLPIAVSAGLALFFGAGQLALRSTDPPRVEEAVHWESFDDLGEPPYEQAILLDFAADWCAPCRRMQVTTFRDPEFARLVEEHGLRPVRVRYEDFGGDRGTEWDDVLFRYRIFKGIPALVIIARSGRVSRAISGLRNAQELRYEFGRAENAMEGGLLWHEPSHPPGGEARAIRILSFNNRWYLPVAARLTWRNHPSPELVGWLEEHTDLIVDRFRSVPAGSEYYARHGVRAVPTIIALDRDGREIARFEGAVEIERAPGEIAAAARERGIAVPDPPRPYIRPPR